MRFHRTDFGDVAQLGERVNGIHEVRGSIPLVSTDVPGVTQQPLHREVWYTRDRLLFPNSFGRLAQLVRALR